MPISRKNRTAGQTKWNFGPAGSIRYWTDRNFTSVKSSRRSVDGDCLFAAARAGVPGQLVNHAGHAPQLLVHHLQVARVRAAAARLAKGQLQKAHGRGQ